MEQVLAFAFALCADAHCDLMHDGAKRLRAFVDEAKRENAAFLMNLGDFCRPVNSQRTYIDIWNSFPGPKYMALGNHDCDHADKLTMMKFLGMERAHGSFDYRGFHFCLLDTNFVKHGGVDYDYAHGNYFAYPDERENLSQAQLAWLAADLRATAFPCVLLSHASLLNPQEGIRNGAQVRALIDEINHEAGYTKVFASLNGHNHIDSHVERNGVHYIDINSMSNFWIGEKYRHATFGPLVDLRRPYIRYTVPYRDSLFTMVRMDASARTMEIVGARTQFVGKSPKELGHPGDFCGFPIVPEIRNRVIHY